MDMENNNPLPRGEIYKHLYLRISYATARDGHIREIGVKVFGIFIILRTYANSDNIAFPSLRTIARLSGSSIKTVEKLIKILEDKGWIEKLDRMRKANGKFGSMQYQILEVDLVRGSEGENFIDSPVVKNANGK